MTEKNSPENDHNHDGTGDDRTGHDGIDHDAETRPYEADASTQRLEPVEGDAAASSAEHADATASDEQKARPGVLTRLRPAAIPAAAAAVALIIGGIGGFGIGQATNAGSLQQDSATGPLGARNGGTSENGVRGGAEGGPAGTAPNGVAPTAPAGGDESDSTEGSRPTPPNGAGPGNGKGPGNGPRGQAPSGAPTPPADPNA